MITQKINPLKLSFAFLENGAETRYSILDIAVLLLINEHQICSKPDLVELLYGDRTASKSSLDRPVKRLLEAGYITKEYQGRVSTKGGKARWLYQLSKAGEKLLKSCA